MVSKITAFRLCLKSFKNKADIPILSIDEKQSEKLAEGQIMGNYRVAENHLYFLGAGVN